ncbi:hypothetical protein BOX15_Mlig005109g1 [Macrostomum lignano]|uniref:PDZ domain-containing protein n=1 Tax=Macrostomum lignano TaxID=282301 RepID=A0A267DTF7_9PLAT|nr:hypothetical protein BOX15_Mlig005109g1 [Macrostomum lignano]
MAQDSFRHSPFVESDSHIAGSNPVFSDASENNNERHPSALPSPYTKSIHRRAGYSPSPSPPPPPPPPPPPTQLQLIDDEAPSFMPTSSTTDSGFPTAELDQLDAGSDGGRSCTPVSSAATAATTADSTTDSRAERTRLVNSFPISSPPIRETDLLSEAGADSVTAATNGNSASNHGNYSDADNQQQIMLSARCAALEREAEYYKQQQGTTMEELDKSDRLNDRLKAEIAFLRAQQQQQQHQLEQQQQQQQQQQQHDRQHSASSGGGGSNGSFGYADSNYHVIYTGTRVPASPAYPMPHHQQQQHHHQHVLHNRLQQQPTPPPSTSSLTNASASASPAAPAGAGHRCQSCEALQSMCAALHRKQSEAASGLRASEQEKTTLRMQLDQLAAEARSLADDRLTLLRQVSDLRVALYREQENAQAVSTEWRKVMSERADVHEEIRQLTSRGELAEDRLRAVEAQRDEALEACRQRRCCGGGEAAAELAKLREEAGDLRQLQATARSQRDWALQQRASALEEREALRNLCEQLRAERDQAVSRHADTMQRCDLLEAEKRQLANQLQEAAAAANQFAEAVSESKDAGETAKPAVRDGLVNVDIGPIGKNIGFQVTGGPHQPLAVNDTSLYVLNVIPGSQADGKLRVNDQICRVNGANVVGRSAEEVYAALQACSGSASCVLTVRRRRVHWRTHPVCIRLSGARPADLIQLDAGFYVKRVLQRPPGCRPVSFDDDNADDNVDGGNSGGDGDGGCGGIAIGDRVLSIDGRQLDGLSLAEARQVLAECRTGGSSGPCQLLICPYRAYASRDEVRAGPPSDVSVADPLIDSGVTAATGSAQSPDSALSSMTKSPTGHWSTETAESESSVAGSGSGNGHRKDSVLDRLINRFRSAGGGGGSKAKKSSSGANAAAASDCIAEREEVAAIDELDSMLRGYDRRRGGGGGGSGISGGGNGKKFATVHGDHFVDSSGGSGPGCVNTDKEIGAKRKERPPLPFVFPTAGGAAGNRLSPMSPTLPVFDHHHHHQQQQQQQQHRYSNGSYHQNLQQPTPPPQLQPPQPRLGVLSTSMANGSLSPEPGPVVRSDETIVRSHYERRPKSSGTTTSRLAKADKRLSAAPVLVAERNGSGGGSSGGSVGSGGGHAGTSVARPDVLPWLGGGGSNERIRIPSSASVSKTGSGSRLSSVSSSSADSGGCSNGIASRETGAAALSTHSAAAAAAASAAASGTATERRPRPGSVRQVRMDKGSEPLGIRIHAGQQGGIYISTVQPGSLADRAGLLAGDRILEFCGVNLRTAFYHNAKQVLNDCREEVATLLVQYCRGADNDTTPTNSPSVRHQQLQHLQQQQPQQPHQHQQSDAEEPRLVCLQPSAAGFSFVGGSETGILVSDVPAESAGQGLRPGDLILQCNGVDFRGLTAESASQELGRAAAATDEETRLLVQHRPARLAAIGSATEPDALFVRPNFSQLPAAGGVVDGDEQQPPPEPLLAFRRHDLLLVTDTRPAGRPAGWWFAWLLDGAGQRVRSGFMPSPRRLQQQQQQQQLALMQNPAAGGLGSRSVSLRRSAGKRGGTSSSSSSSASASASASTADYLHPHLRLPLPAYSRAELVPDPGRAGPRPVAILGPLSEALGRALCAERSDLFYPLGPLPLDRVAGACGGDSAKHGLLQLASGPAQVDQLHRLHRVYPIVLLLRYRSHKLVKEARDPRYCPEKFPSRVAKDMVAKAAQLEEELQPVLTACIQGGAFAFMCSQVVSVVSRDQNCPVWINAEPIVP